MLVAVYLLAGIWRAGRRARKYERIAHTEQTRSAWAEARAYLLDLVRQGKLSPRSLTFRTLYQVQTFILRRPDAYGEIAVHLRDAILTGPGEPPPWLEERQSWPKEVNEVFRRMAQGTSLLIFGYPRWGRVFQVAKLLGRLLVPAVAGTIRQWALTAVRKMGATLRALRVESDLLDARAQMKKLAEEERQDSGSWRLQPVGT
jgi:hypothetical protein